MRWKKMHSKKWRGNEGSLKGHPARNWLQLKEMDKWHIS